MDFDQILRRNLRFFPVFLILFSLSWTLALSLWPRQGSALAAFFSPAVAGQGAVAAVWGAGAEQILAFGGWPPVVLVRSDAPDFIARLHAAGAWLVVRAPAGGELCSTRPPLALR